MDDFTYLVINLDRSPDRLKIIENLFSENSKTFQRWPGVDGRLIDRFKQEDVTSFCKIFCSNGMIGCGLSHLSVWEYVSKIDDPNKMFIVLEDDSYIDFNLLEKNKTLMKSKIKYGSLDIIHLGEAEEIKSFKNKIEDGLDSSLYKSKNILGLYGYLINNIGAKKIYDDFKKSKIFYHIDLMMVFKNLNRGIMKPYIVTTRGKKESTMVNHSEKFLMRLITNEYIYYNLKLPILSLWGAFDITLYLLIILFISLILLFFRPIGFIFIFLGLLLSDSF